LLHTTANQPASAAPVTRDEILLRANALVPVLAARSEEAERLRRCPDETIRDLTEAGLLRVCQPSRFGGYELGYDVLCEMVQTLARGCGSQAWVAMVLADNPLKFSAFELQAQDEVWGSNPDAKLSVGILPALGKATPVEGGGVRWNGTHRYSSGIDHADWVICGGSVIRNGEPAEPVFALIPTSEVEIIDDWKVIGLAGSGTKSFKVNDVYVPSHRVLDKRLYETWQSPGTLFYTSPVSKLPRGGVSAVSYTAVAVGIAQGFLDEYLVWTAKRPKAGEVGAQIDAGTSAAEIEAAERLYLGAIRETMDVLERGEKVTPHMSAQGKRNAAFSAQLAMRAVERLFKAGGASALYVDNPLQRKFRDVYAASAHHALDWDAAAAAYGRFRLDAHAPAKPV
jgi:3-hydroxy-9,10-secoandrosta-1,3,5(10)-triene-9,17-dione monooxygenase